ncbi:hypothetical protein [Herbaspirillum autotrophicum]|uniref:hypothetical protein n=1 Tax=Herbaspirillum autotrophicum TaxID=180195 RepID=UPI00067C6028|nr:hypothetical protein [Herbaspirillum autotrophicum]
MANTFAMTALLIALGLTGNSVMAAEVGLVQSATLALLYAFSANARSLILSKSSPVSAHSMMMARLLLLLPLAAVSYWLSVNVGGVASFLAIILIARRCVEWLGEVHLSEMERLGNQDVARQYFLHQSVLLAVAMVWLIGHFPFPLLGLSIWAFLPLVFSARFIWTSVTTSSTALTGVIAKILPHLGSTAIIGITVYVFRLLILLIVGKETAGDLYTAFAIGGLTGSVFANALGASIALHEQRGGKRYFPRLLRHVLNLSLLIGIFIFIAAFQKFSVLSWTGKSYFFWEATGLAMIGGVVMVYAQRVRFRLLQHDEEHDVFGPDVLMNILIIALVPFVFYLFGKEAMSSLYLLNSLLAFIFYTSAKKEKKENQDGLNTIPLKQQYLRLSIGILLLLPLFFQISAGVFRNTAVDFDAGGVLRNLPIPISVLACAGGIVLLGAYRRAFVSFGVIFLTCVLMVMSAIIVTQDQPVPQQAKFILLIQFILPMFALVLGQVYEPVKTQGQDNSCAKAFLLVLLMVVPVQLVFTWIQGLGYLSPDIGLFAVYQDLQYVSVIFIAAYLLALFSLWNVARYKFALLILLPLMAVYAVASMSMLAMGLLFVGLLIFSLFHLVVNAEKVPFVGLLLVLVFAGSYFYFEKEKMAFKFGSIETEKSESSVASARNAALYLAVPGNVVQAGIEIPNGIVSSVDQRLDHWKYYFSQITNGPKSFFLGVSAPPDRDRYPSAYNYYLDFIYNFGVLAFFPLLFVIGSTLVQIVICRREVFESPALLGLGLVVLFLLIVDNSLKVGLRQPYPGIFTFFLWGILLTKLSKITSKKNHAFFE